MNMRTTLTIALILLPIAPAVGQTAGSADSPLLGLPNALSVDPTSKAPNGSLLDPTAVLAKDYGFATVAPGFFTVSASKPDFRPVAMFPGVAPRPDLDAMSIGLDWIWATASGQVVIPPAPSWSALTFSVSRTSVGAVGSRIALEAARSDGVAGDLLSYFFPCPALTPELRDKVFLVQDSSEISAWDGANRGNVDGHDVFMALYDLDPALLAFLPATPYFYFSVTKASLALVPPAWWGGTLPSGASILRMRWLGGAWTPPTVWIRYDQLGLSSDADLDALAVDETHGFLLFSTKGNASDEIMFANLNADSIATAVYRYPGTPEVPVSVHLGLVAGDDIDAICALDPGDQSSVMRGAFVARPLSPLLPFPRSVSGATFRRQATTPGQAQIESWLTGFPLHQAQPGFGVFFVQGVTPATSPIQLFQTTRNPLGPHEGAPTRAVVQLPNLPGLLGVDLDFTWAAFDLALTVVDFTIPARLRV